LGFGREGFLGFCFDLGMMVLSFTVALGLRRHGGMWAQGLKLPTQVGGRPVNLLLWCGDWG
jgi:hypothetical protein